MVSEAPPPLTSPCLPGETSSCTSPGDGGRGEEPAGDGAGSQQPSAAEGRSGTLPVPSFSCPPLGKHMLNPSVSPRLLRSSQVLTLVWTRRLQSVRASLYGWVGQGPPSTCRHLISRLLPAAEGFLFWFCLPASLQKQPACRER